MPSDIFAQYPIEIRFPDDGLSLFDEAARALDEEYRNSIKLTRLPAARVTQVLGPLYAIETGAAIEFDSTWEGALAFRPDVEPDVYINDAEDLYGSMIWSGEIVEVDETAGVVFVTVTNLQRLPQTGSFYVRPFGFLENLHRVYCHPSFEGLRERIEGRLRASLGAITGNGAGPGEFGKLLGGKWSILWGPPGTGKTFTVGRIAASLLGDPEERLLIVSTTNRATDEAAISVGRAARNSAWQGLPEAIRGDLARIGKGPGLRRFEEYGLEEMIEGAEFEILHEIASLEGKGSNLPAGDRALLRERILTLQHQLTDNAADNFLAPGVKVVVGTAHKALTLLNHRHVREMLAGGKAPFTTVIIDESGLVSRAATAALSLLAARRVLLAGDSKQLAPISHMSRLLPSSQSRWLETSALDHLGGTTTPCVHLLAEQYRMHPQISRAVSNYQYDGRLRDAAEVIDRRYRIPVILTGQPRSIWYVLDDDAENFAAIRSERGPGNRSWIRRGTQAALRKLFSDPTLREAAGIYLSPFRAQVREIAGFLAEESLTSWTAATVHSQQGAETDIVILDTVNAGSCAWPYDEWKRLINVGISRAREAVILLASRAEMHEPYLCPLLESFAPRVPVRSENRWAFRDAPSEKVRRQSIAAAGDAHLLGSQIGMRKNLRPVFSAEQQRLIGLKLDGKPRLVRGVAGSGKTVVLAHWLVRSVRELESDSTEKIWAVYANRALEGLILRTIEEAAGDRRFPWNRVSLLHIKDILQPRMRSIGLDLDSYEFDWDRASRDYLARHPAMEPCCDALFIDEAQDMGPHTLKLLGTLVRQKDSRNPNSRSINIFYDNAQNIYGRKPPAWSDLGLDLRGRSTIMRESFRSTRRITEFAINLLYRLQPPEADDEHRELLRLGLIEKEDSWWRVNYNQIEGPRPSLHRFPTIDQEIDAIGDQIVNWIRDEAVNPDDICVIYNGANLARRIEERIGPKLEAIGRRIAVQSSRGYAYDSRTVFATTPHSFKGYDSEIVVIAGVDQFVAADGVLASTLYVAMTRARSMLHLYARDSGTQMVRGLLGEIETCLNHR